MADRLYIVGSSTVNQEILSGVRDAERRKEFRRLLQEELFRTISVRDGDDVLRLPAVKAVLRQTIRLALKGNSPAQRKVIDMVQAIGKASDGSFDPGAMSLEGLIIESYRKHEAVEHRQQTHSEVNSSGSHEFERTMTRTAAASTRSSVSNDRPRGFRKPATTLSRKDWLSAAKRAVVSLVSLGSLLPCRLHRRRGAAVVTARCCASTPEQAMSKLTDTQLVTLSAASQRDDRGIVLPPNLKGGAAQKLVAKLIEFGLVEEIRARGDLPVWRRDDDNRAMALRITKRGLKAIAVEDDPDDQQGSEDRLAALEGAATADARRREAPARGSLRQGCWEGFHCGSARRPDPLQAGPDH